MGDPRAEAEACLREGLDAIAMSRTADYGSEYRGDLERALGHFEKAITLDRDCAEAWFQKLVVLGQLDSHAQAARASDEVRLRPDDPEAWLHRGIALGHVGRHDEALCAFEKVLRRRPKDWEAMYRKGLALQAAGRHDDERRAWQDVLRMGLQNSGPACTHSFFTACAPRHALNVRFFLANSLARLGRRQDALEEYRRAIHEGAEHLYGPMALFGFVDALRSFEEAREAYRETIRPGAEDKMVWWRAGHAFSQAGRSADALAAFEKMLELDPRHADAWFHKGEALLQSNRRGEALEAFQQSQRLGTTYSGAVKTRIQQLGGG